MQQAIFFDIDGTLIRCALGIFIPPGKYSHEKMFLNGGLLDVTIEFFYLSIFLNTLKYLLANPDLYTVGFITAGAYSKEDILTLFSKQLGSNIPEEKILFFNRFDADKCNYEAWVNENVVLKDTPYYEDAIKENISLGNKPYSYDFVKDQKAFQILCLLESNGKTSSAYKKICLLDDQFEYYVPYIQYASRKILKNEEKFICIPVNVSNDGRVLSDNHLQQLCIQLSLDPQKILVSKQEKNCLKRSSDGGSSSPKRGFFQEPVLPPLVYDADAFFEEYERRFYSTSPINGLEFS